MVYFSLTVLIFFILNRIFYLLYNFQISSFIRVYSLWLYLAVVVVNQNIDIFTFLAVRHFFNMFYFDCRTKLVQVVSVLAIGVLGVVAVMVYPISVYFYRNLSKYFLSNLYRINGALFITTVRFALKPIIEAIIHGFFYENPVLQLFLISVSCFLTSLVLMYMEYSSGIFVFKCILVCDWLM